MDRERFIERFYEESPIINNGEVERTLTKSIESLSHDGYPRGHRNLIIATEELAELTQEITKHLRGKGDYYNILQELADVRIVLWYVQEVCGINEEELNKAVNVKIHRLQGKLERGEFK